MVTHIRSSSRFTAGRFWILAVTLATFALRISMLDAKGLSYDEAASALMARASFIDIVEFHWHAAFEHLPGWVLLVRSWSFLAGQNEYALRTLSAMASTVTPPLVWILLSTQIPPNLRLRVMTATLVALSPVLQLYGQEARMYALVVALGFAATLVWFTMLRRPRWYHALLFTILGWSMLSLQYYSALLLAGLALCTLYDMLRDRHWRLATCAWQSIAVVITLLPVVIWMLRSPGFAETLDVVLGAADETSVSAHDFLHEAWLDLSFGAVRWTPPIAVVGYLLLVPLAVGIGGIFGMQLRPRQSSASLRRYDSFFVMLTILGLVPLGITATVLPTASTRYILFVAPFLLSLVAVGLDLIWRWRRLAGQISTTLVTVTCMMGLTYYFGTYEKSEYRQMARYLAARIDATRDVVMLEAPRQHLLAKYYLPPTVSLTPIPAGEMPAFWPYTAPLVIPHETDDVVQSSLAAAQSIWVIYAGEGEVDPGEFLAKYLTAVSFQEDCNQWLDVRLCHYISPFHIAGTRLEIEPDVSFAQELRLRSAQVAPYAHESDPQNVSLLVQLDWIADQKPSRDYKVTLRLLQHDRVLAQSDALPIGRLLPPTTWQRGDSKPGYMVLPVPPLLSEGCYSLHVGLYDPDSLGAIEFTAASQSGNGLLNLAQIQIGDTITVVASADVRNQ